jgi:hypothetical protein
MEMGYPVDLRAVFGVIDSAEVIIFRFVTTPQCLLFDARHNGVEGPLLRVVGPVESPKERFKSIKKLRPRFRLPEKVAAVSWPKYVQSLADCGAWERILRRIGSCGYPEIADRAGDVLRDMEMKERAEFLNAIIGAGYHSLWERTS